MRAFAGILARVILIIFALMSIAGCDGESADSAGSSDNDTNYSDASGYAIVDTGQFVCYDDQGELARCPDDGEPFDGQDSQHDCNQHSYTDNSDGMVTDNITGLMWQQSPDTDGDGDIDAADKLSYDEAVAGAGSLRLGGYTDWRLPTIKELYSLIDFSGVDPSGYEGTDTSGLIPFIDTAYFDFAYGDTSAGERIIDAQYASSSLYAANTAGDGGRTLFGVNFADGRIKGYGLTLFGSDKTFFVIYVRGNTSYGLNDFEDNGDGTITDYATGLMWSQADSGEGLNWEEALAWVEQKNTEDYLDYRDWRLPNAKELQSIVDYARSPDTTASAAINALLETTAITNEAGEADYPCYWSGTTHANWTASPGTHGAYVAFGRAMGYMGGSWVDVHGAGAQRSDPKSGDPDDYPSGFGPQGDAIRIYNYVRLVRDEESVTATSGVFDGYMLMAPLGSFTTYLIDTDELVDHTWTSSYRPGNSAYLLDDGLLLRTGNVTNGNRFASTGGVGGIVEKLDWGSNVTWSYSLASDDECLHHDVEELPNGNILMIAWEYKTSAEAIAAGRDSSLLTDGELWPDKIIEVDPSDNSIVWEWHVWDHLVQDYDNSKENYGVIAGHSELIDLNYVDLPSGIADWNHINSVDYNTELDQILLSVHGFDEFWVIDHSTTTAEAASHSGGTYGKGGDILYRWGNPAAYGASGDHEFYGQHDAQWIPSDSPGAGNILVFNNGQGRPDGSYSTVEEIVPDVNPDGSYPVTIGEAFDPSSQEWVYMAPNPTDFYGHNISGAQRLPNGNTLICEGPDGYIFEVTNDGTVVWTYQNTDGTAAFRVIKYSYDYSGLSQP